MRRDVIRFLRTATCLLAFASPSVAQTPRAPAHTLTLDEVLEVALARSETVHIAQSDVQRAEGEQRRARSGLFPQLSANATYTRLLASEFEGLFDNAGAFGGNADQEALNSLPFGRRNTWSLNLSFSQNLFSGGRIGAQRQQADADRALAALTVNSTAAQFLLQATEAYYDAALSSRLVAIAEATAGQSEATLRQVRASFEAGVQPEFELIRAQVNRDNQTPIVIRQRANREIAFLRLKQLLELPASIDLDIADALDDPMLPAPPVFAARLASAVAADAAAEARAIADRTVIAQADQTTELREAAVDAAKAERMPSFAFTSGYGRVAYPGVLFPTLGDFRTNWNISVTAQVPILTGGALRANEQIARAQLDQSRIQAQLTRELTEVDSRSAYAELRAAQAAWEATGGTVQQATRAYQIADVRYRAGVSTQLELSDSRLQLAQAGANRAQAARELQVARARVALLPNLPLGTVPGTTSPPPQAPAATPQTPQTPVRPAVAAPLGQLRSAALMTTTTTPLMTTTQPGGPR